MAWYAVCTAGSYAYVQHLVAWCTHIFIPGLQLNSRSLKYTWADNDICCAVGSGTKDLPLDSLKSVEVETGCCIDCGVEGVKQVSND